MLALVLAAAARLALAGAFAASPFAPERGFCATAYTLSGDTLTVTALAPAAGVRGASPLSVAFDCPAGALPVHTHTGAVCSVNLWTCELPATPLPCLPSAQDRAALDAADRPAAVVACRDGSAVAWRASAVGGSR